MKDNKEIRDENPGTLAQILQSWRYSSNVFFIDCEDQIQALCGMALKVAKGGFLNSLLFGFPGSSKNIPFRSGICGKVDGNIILSPVVKDKIFAGNDFVTSVCEIIRRRS